MAGIVGSLTDLFTRVRGRLVVAIVLVIGLYFVVAFGQQAWKARALEAEVAGRQAALATMQARHDALQQQVNIYQSAQYQSYVERIARRDLNLSKPGETVILTQLVGTPVPEVTPTPTATPVTGQQANWGHWLTLFHLP
ncbi:MAG TPA: septum formation initiator family protein [Thermomicrobiaceae bacterium]|nr:septum formation initiator family protein [Thermomicrobiaceae bacterium]